MDVSNNVSVVEKLSVERAILNVSALWTVVQEIENPCCVIPVGLLKTGASGWVMTVFASEKVE